MQIQLKKSKINSFSELKITGSKSESNRVLLLQALFEGLEIKNISNSDDSQLMQKALKSNSSVVDVHHAGTAKLILTTYYATRLTTTTTLPGSTRKQEHPIKKVVDTLNALRVSIS